MIEMKNIRVSFPCRHGNKKTQIPVRDVSLALRTKEIHALIGASGAGKSLLAGALLGILPHHARIGGTIHYGGRRLSDKEINELRGRLIALIPQSVTFLNPLVPVHRQVFRASRLSGRCRATARRETNASFARSRLADTVKSQLPFQLSGGMARRVLTATATAGKAKFIIADEPTTGLDDTRSRQSLDHLRTLADDGRGVLMITHDIAAAVRVADTISVIREGQIVDSAPPSQFLHAPQSLHSYTQRLWDCLPQNSFIDSPTLLRN